MLQPSQNFFTDERTFMPRAVSAAPSASAGRAAGSSGRGAARSDEAAGAARAKSRGSMARSMAGEMQRRGRARRV